MSWPHEIHAEDLETLERDLPTLAEPGQPHYTNKHRAALRRVQRILTDIRWRYMPHTDHEQIDAGQDMDEKPA